MGARLDPHAVAPDLSKAMLGLEKVVRAAGFDPALAELVKMRASQLNGCGYCLHMHSQEARQSGEAEQRLHLVSAWRESSYFDEREQAALAWTEALTLVHASGAPDAVYDRLAEVFSEEEITKLTFLIMTINAWNRLAVGFRLQHPRGWRAAA